jgi:hypothetical protein
MFIGSKNSDQVAAQINGFSIGLRSSGFITIVSVEVGSK